LTHYYGLTHPSEPNYVAAAGGDYFGIGDDALYRIPSPVLSVVDILEERGISWAEYQQDMPYAGFQGFNYTNPANNYVDYVRKHNPLVCIQKAALITGNLRFRCDQFITSGKSEEFHRLPN
jgi:acid phosphatase